MEPDLLLQLPGLFAGRVEAIVCSVAVLPELVDSLGDEEVEVREAAFALVLQLLELLGLCVRPLAVAALSGPLAATETPIVAELISAPSLDSAARN